MRGLIVKLSLASRESIEKMNDRLQDLINLIKHHEKADGFSELPIAGCGIFSAYAPHAMTPTLYEPMICLVAQGAKTCSVGDQTYRYAKGDLFINFLPLPVETAIKQASRESPFLSVVIHVDLIRLADMILKIDRIKPVTRAPLPASGSSIMTGPSPDSLILQFIRLLDIANNEQDALILGDAVIGELYYRLLTSDYGQELRQLLNQYGQIRPISRVVTHIHDNMHRPIQIHELAEMANMSKTSFFSAFKKIMHVSPNQYIKSTKLRKAHVLLTQGMRANEASYKVGYNSFSQFSREYKRLFGVPPSETSGSQHNSIRSLTYMQG